MAMLTLGTGVGGGLVLGDRIWRGANGMAGEFGHMTVDPEGPLCGCGNRGCLEQYASATALVRLAREMSPDAELNAESIYKLAMQGDEDARRILRTAGRALGIVLASLVNALNLPIYVIGGGVSNAWEAFAPAMFDELQQRSIVYTANAPGDNSATTHGASATLDASRERKTIVTRALLGSDAGLYGAARLPMIARAER